MNEKQNQLTRPAANSCPRVPSEQWDGGPLVAVPISAAIDCYLGPLLTRYALRFRGRLAEQGIIIEVRQGKMYCSPKEKLTDEIRKELELARPWLIRFEGWREKHKLKG